MEKLIVTLSTGKIRGKCMRNSRNTEFFSFQGIPYAKPPTGSLRFKAPQPPEPWTGVLDATKEGPECVSKHVIFDTRVGDENCLTLNVYCPPLDKENISLKPVMVWIHGGGFVAGSGGSDIFGPEFLLTEDIVLVTINYRIGILGFLSLEDPSLDVPGNAGLKDMVMSLKWVQENITNFGGNPNNVTIFGESAGAAAVHYLILSPGAKGLFHKAILQSGCALNIWAKARRYTIELARILGIQTTDEKKILAVLQDLPAEKLLDVSDMLRDDFVASSTRPHGPVIERPNKNAFLCENPLDIIKSGKYSHVPVLTGFTNREGILLEIKNKPKPFQPITDFELTIPNFLNLQRGSDISKLVAKQIKEFYYGDKEPSVYDKDTYYQLETDNFFLRELIRYVKYHAKISPAPIFLYRMSIETTLNTFKNIFEITEPGVCHADDVGYLFKNLLTPEIECGSDEDIAVRRFVTLWTNFAKYGDPNPKKKHSLIDVEWKPVSKNTLNYLDIGRKLTTGVSLPEAHRLAFWDKILEYNPVHKL